MWRDNYNRRQRIRELFSQKYKIAGWNLQCKKLDFTITVKSLAEAKKQFVTIAKANCFHRPIRLELTRWDSFSFRVIHILLKSPSRGNCIHCENKAEYVVDSLSMCKEHAEKYLGELDVN